MNEFRYIGQLPASKSLMNRALIVQSFFPHLKIKGDSTSQDVQQMRQALRQMAQGVPIECGHAGTVFRFMALRTARFPGKHRLVGSERLLARPQNDLLKILGQLGSVVELSKTSLDLQSWGWKMLGDALHAPVENSSQFASAVVLSAWLLPFEICLLLSGKAVSESYLKMTLRMVEQLGMSVKQQGNEIRIPSNQKVTASEIEIEPDMSSAFALAAAATVNGRVSLTGIPEVSQQPDARFIEILKMMGAAVELQNGRLEVHKAKSLKGIQLELTNEPDLFPVLAALCATAEGESQLNGARHLAFKESDRIARTAELLRLCGREVLVFDDGIKIFGTKSPKMADLVKFDPDQDHRMAMAAAVLKLAGEPIEIQNPQVVEKSFPGFWNAVGLQP